jgi:hypothetical protein
LGPRDDQERRTSAARLRALLQNHSVTNEASGAELMRWFAERGYEVTMSNESGQLWANLVATGTGETVARYGSGRNAVEALRRARERYESEH